MEDFGRAREVFRDFEQDVGWDGVHGHIWTAGVKDGWVEEKERRGATMAESVEGIEPKTGDEVGHALIYRSYHHLSFSRVRVYTGNYTRHRHDYFCPSMYDDDDGQLADINTCKNVMDGI
jgi:hypothetical protein